MTTTEVPESGTEWSPAVFLPKKEPDFNIHQTFWYTTLDEHTLSTMDSSCPTGFSEFTSTVKANDGPKGGGHGPPQGTCQLLYPPDLWQSCWLHIVSLITFFLLSNTWSWAGTQSGLQWFRRINLMFQGFYGAHLDTTVKTSKERSGAESIQ